MRRVTLRSLWEHKRRLVSTVVAIVLGVAFMSGTLVFADTIDQGVDGFERSRQRGELRDDGGPAVHVHDRGDGVATQQLGREDLLGLAPAASHQHRLLAQGRETVLPQQIRILPDHDRGRRQQAVQQAALVQKCQASRQ